MVALGLPLHILTGSNIHVAAAASTLSLLLTASGLTSPYCYIALLPTTTPAFVSLPGLPRADGPTLPGTGYKGSL